MRPVVGEALTPLMEGPDPDGGELGESKRSGTGSGLGQWVKGQLSRTPSVAGMGYRRSDLRLLLGVMGAPLAPVHVSDNDPLPHLSIKDTPIVSSLTLSLLLMFAAIVSVFEFNGFLFTWENFYFNRYYDFELKY